MVSDVECQQHQVLGLVMKIEIADIDTNSLEVEYQVGHIKGSIFAVDDELTIKQLLNLISRQVAVCVESEVPPVETCSHGVILGTFCAICPTGSAV